MAGFTGIGLGKLGLLGSCQGVSKAGVSIFLDEKKYKPKCIRE